MSQELPQIVKCAERLLLEVELAVRTFTRFNRYDIGASLRQQAFDMASLAMRAWREPANRRNHVDQLVRSIDEFQTRLRLGKKLKVFASFKQFDALGRTTYEFGCQAGGWRKQQHLKGRNPAPPSSAATERAQILSSHAASAEANG